MTAAFFAGRRPQRHLLEVAKERTSGREGKQGRGGGKETERRPELMQRGDRKMGVTRQQQELPKPRVSRTPREGEILRSLPLPQATNQPARNTCSYNTTSQPLYLLLPSVLCVSCTCATAAENGRLRRMPPLEKTQCTGGHSQQSARQQRKYRSLWLLRLVLLLLLRLV